MKTADLLIIAAVAGVAFIAVRAVNKHAAASAPKTPLAGTGSPDRIYQTTGGDTVHQYLPNLLGIVDSGGFDNPANYG